MTAAQLRHVRELLTQIANEALRGSANLASGQARTGAYSLGKIGKLAEDAGRVLDGEAPAPAGPAPFLDPELAELAQLGELPQRPPAAVSVTAAGLLDTIGRYGPCELSLIVRESEVLAELVESGQVLICSDGTRRGFGGRTLYRLAGGADRPTDDPRYSRGAH